MFKMPYYAKTSRSAPAPMPAGVETELQADHRDSPLPGEQPIPQQPPVPGEPPTPSDPPVVPPSPMA